MIEPPAELGHQPGVVGVGIDVVDVERMRLALGRTERFGTRYFTESELARARPEDPAPSLAARFAAKEAVLKALGLGIFDLPLREIEVTGGGDTPPAIRLHAGAAQAAADRGVGRWFLSLTHDGGVAAAVVVAVAPLG